MTYKVFGGMLSLTQSINHVMTLCFVTVGKETLKMQTSTKKTDDDDGHWMYQGHVLIPSSLLLQQFFAIFVKRCYYVRRNWKGLFSQILLPALFVCVAMTVALTAPQVYCLYLSLCILVIDVLSLLLLVIDFHPELDQSVISQKNCSSCLVEKLVITWFLSIKNSEIW